MTGNGSDSARAGLLTVCMIVKNEAELLGRCLSSVRSAADEIVVVDTGSTDATREIALQYGAKLAETEWRDDFAHARNISLDAATCRWILWLDADDVVPAATLPVLEKLKRRAPDCVWGFVVRNERPGGTGTEFIQARMFPNRPDLRFERRIHEQIMPGALRAGLRLESCEAVVEHHGYADPQTLKQKAARNVRLLLLEYPAGVPDAVTATEIADSYQLIENDDEADRWYRTVLGFGNEAVSAVLMGHAHYGIGNICSRCSRYAEAIDHFNQALSLTPWRSDVLYSSAVAHELSGDKATAVELLRRIPSIKPQACQVGVDFRSAVIKSYLRILRLLVELGQFEAAVRTAADACADAGNRPEIHNAVGKVYLRTGAFMDALHAFEKSLQLRREGNLDAFIGLGIIFHRAGKHDRLHEMFTSIASTFGADLRFRIAWRALLGTDLPGQSTADAGVHVPENLAMLERDFFGMLPAVSAEMTNPA